MYTVATDDESRHEVDALPAEALAPFAEARAALEVAPWTSGVAYNPLKPDTPMRQLMFGPHGQGVITYLVDERRVDILRVLWWSR